MRHYTAVASASKKKGEGGAVVGKENNTVGSAAGVRGVGGGVGGLHSTADLSAADLNTAQSKKDKKARRRSQQHTAEVYIWSIRVSPHIVKMLRPFSIKPSWGA